MLANQPGESNWVRQVSAAGLEIFETVHLNQTNSSTAARLLKIFTPDFRPEVFTLIWKDIFTPDLKYNISTDPAHQ